MATLTGWFLRTTGCSGEVTHGFEFLYKPRGQEFLEELDVWFTSRREKNKPAKKPSETGLYMVHYVDDLEDKKNLREMLIERGAEIDNAK